jgi:hypothetical protein
MNDRPERSLRNAEEFHSFIFAEPMGKRSGS